MYHFLSDAHPFSVGRGYNHDMNDKFTETLRRQILDALEIWEAQTQAEIEARSTKEGGWNANLTSDDITLILPFALEIARRDRVTGALTPQQFKETAIKGAQQSYQDSLNRLEQRLGGKAYLSPERRQLAEDLLQFARREEVEAPIKEFTNDMRQWIENRFAESPKADSIAAE